MRRDERSAGAPHAEAACIAPHRRANLCGRPVKEDTLVVHEIYASVQGESSFAGLRCAFVRLTGCNLRCAWCDTTQAFHGGERLARREVLARSIALGTPLVELTGGEPLLQPGSIPLLRELCDAGKTVLLETSGEADVSRVDPRVHKIMDLKAPGSGEHRRNRWSNLAHLGPGDEIKFVLAGRADYEWMRATIGERGLDRLGPRLLVSAVWAALDPKELVAWVLEDRLDVRVQVQLHKVIWGAKAQGV
jgi:7-carboxy-7-deazaguanine synthase